jgi:phage portal protein BeeE
MRLADRFRNLFRWRPQYSRAYIGIKQAGVPVTQDTAMAYSAVHACVRVISETMAALPWQVYRRAELGREPHEHARLA